jgi:hypothetical protein
VCLSVTLLILILLVLGVNSKWASGSPNFGNQEVRDEPFDWVDMLHNRVSTISGHPSLDILAVNYFSNGYLLNSTLWLSGNFSSDLSIGEDIINYGMLIDADSDKETGIDGVDYQIEISGQDGKWNRKFWQYSSLGSHRTLEDDRNLTGFAEERGKYVTLSADLSSMGFPGKYRILFYAEQVKKGSLWKSDFTNWIYIPRPDFEISPLPNSLSLTQGETKSIELKVKSTTGFEPDIYFFHNKSNEAVNKAELNFESMGLHMPSFGVKTMPVTVHVFDDAKVGQHTILISANGTFPATQFIGTVSSPNQGFIVPSFVKSENFTKQTDFVVEVKPKIPLIDQGLEWLNRLQFPITFTFGLLTGHIFPWLLNKIKNRKKSKPNWERDDWTEG